MKNDYRYVVFDYIGGSFFAQTPSKYRFYITGKKGIKAYIAWAIAIAVCLFVSVWIYIFFSLTLNSNSIILKIKFPYSNLVAILIGAIPILIKKALIYKRLEPKGSSLNIYNRELPSKLRPAHLRILLEDGLVDEISLGATIIDLIDRGYLKYNKEREPYNKLEFFSNENVKLVKTEKSNEALLKYESFMIDWFINECGNGQEVNSIDIHQALINKKTFRTNLDAADMFAEWQALVLMSFPIEKYYKKIKNKKNNMYIWFGLGLIGLTGLIPFFSLLLGTFGWGYGFLINVSYVLNKNGIDEICEWLSLKKFLIDFGDMQDKTVEMVEIWDFYLTYSIVLGTSSKARKEINSMFEKSIYSGMLDIGLNTMEKYGYFNYMDNNIKFGKEKEFEEKQKMLFENLKLDIEEEYGKL